MLPSLHAISCLFKAKTSSTTTISWRQGSCLQGQGSKQIRNLLAGSRSWLPMLFFWSLKIFGRFYCVFSSALTIWKGLKGPLVDAFPLLVSSSKTVRNILFWLDSVCLGSVAKLLQPKSSCKRLSSINLPNQLHSCESKWNDEVVWRYMETFSILYWICYHPSMQYHAFLKQKPHLPRQFLGVRGLVYKGRAVSRSAICLLGLGAGCLCFSSGLSRFLGDFTVCFLPPWPFEKVWKVLLWMRFPFWFLLLKLSRT